MKALKFTLSGRSAFFKKPEVNSYYYFTYGQIHKVALLGMFGAVLGYQGYGQKVWKSKEKKSPLVVESPEFYERLKDIKVSVVPKNRKGYIPKKVQYFNNSVGYASQEQGGNLIVKEQWLENPKWEIYVLIDCEEAQRLADFVVDQRCIYIPYLGKNDHMADIKEAVVVELAQNENKEIFLSSLYPKDQARILLPDDDDDEEEMDGFKYEETLPVGLDEYTNLYTYRVFCFTDFKLQVKNTAVYRMADQNLIFY